MRVNNGSIRKNLMANMESDEFRELQRAIAKANGIASAVSRQFAASILRQI